MDPDRALLPRGARADPADRRVHVPRLRRQAAATAHRAGKGRAIRLPPLRRGSRTGTDLARVRVLAARLQRVRGARDVRGRAAAARPPVQSPAPGARRAGARVQHGGELHHQHELAGVHARVDHGLPHPDGGACLAQLHLGGGGGGKTIGNFWVDLVRSTLYVLLPISFVYALFLVSQGVLQNLAPYRELLTLEGTKQTLAMGPVASQEAIKMLGTNGGGFFNANSAHPFENPNPFTNLVQ